MLGALYGDDVLARVCDRSLSVHSGRGEAPTWNRQSCG